MTRPVTIAIGIMIARTTETRLNILYKLLVVFMYYIKLNICFLETNVIFYTLYTVYISNMLGIFIFSHEHDYDLPYVF